MSFKAKEVAIVLSKIEEALKEYILANNTDVKEDDLFISLVEAKEGSLILKLIPNITRYFKPAITAVCLAITTNNASGLPPNSIDALHAVQRVIKAKNCTGDFYVNSKEAARITANTDISIPKSELITGDTIIYAEVLRVGGSDPRVRIKLDNGYSFSLKVKQQMAQQLAKRLYNEVGFRGNASWLKSNHSIVNFRIDSIIDSYEPTTNKEAFKEISGIIGKYWNDIDENEFLNN